MTEREFLQKVWLEVYLKCLETKFHPVHEAATAVENAKIQFTESWSVTEEEQDAMFNDGI